MSNENQNGGQKMDLKNLGIGGVAGGSVIGLMMMLQNQGIDLVSSKQEAMSRANEKRIDQLEQTVRNLNTKLDAGFESIRTQITSNMNTISSQLQLAASDRYTKTEHTSYAASVESRIQRLEDEVRQFISPRK